VAEVLVQVAVVPMPVVVVPVPVVLVPVVLVVVEVVGMLDAVPEPPVVVVVDTLRTVVVDELDPPIGDTTCDRAW
jgi:hypothetical protein